MEFSSTLDPAVAIFFAEDTVIHVYVYVYISTCIYVRGGRDMRGAIGGSLGAKIVFSGAASNIALTSPSSWKEFNISKVAPDDGRLSHRTSHNSKWKFVKF